MNEFFFLIKYFYFGNFLSKVYFCIISEKNEENPENFENLSPIFGRQSAVLRASTTQKSFKV